MFSRGEKKYKHFYIIVTIDLYQEQEVQDKNTYFSPNKMIKILFVLIGTLASWCISIGVSRFGHDSSRYDVPRHSNISNNENEVKNPLDKVLMGYEKRARPYFGSDRPVTVGVSAYVLSISSISEVDMVN